MNLTHLNVQEMNTQELQTVDGGGFWDTAAYVGAVYVSTGISFFNSFVEGFNAGANATVEAHENVYH